MYVLGTGLGTMYRDAPPSYNDIKAVTGVMYGDKFLQLGDWRIGDVDGTHFAFSHKGGKCAMIFREDGTQHHGPRGGDQDRWLWEDCRSTLNAVPPTVLFGKNYIQLGLWRIGESAHNEGRGHFSVEHVQGKVAMIFRTDGTQHPGPRNDYRCGHNSLADPVPKPDSLVLFGNTFLQLGDWRIGDVDGTHFAFSHKGGKCAMIFREDGTQHPGPRTQWDDQDRWLFTDGLDVQSFIQVQGCRNTPQPQYLQQRQYPSQSQYPTQPHQPQCPTQPQYPSQPQRPTQPQYPTQPQNPQYPSQPQCPQQPQNPTQPQYPQQPQYPTQPQYPQQPQYPTQPQYPQYPSQPQYPQQPQYPTQPQYPQQLQYPTQPQYSSQNFFDCPKCNGKGGVGTFGPCRPSDVHFKKACVICNGSKKVQVVLHPCPKCNGKGGSGTFGPCEEDDVHFKRPCATCVAGHGYVQRSNMHPCKACQQKGGCGTFGPCDVGDVHFKSLCTDCQGKCFV